MLNVIQRINAALTILHGTSRKIDCNAGGRVAIIRNIGTASATNQGITARIAAQDIIAAATDQRVVEATAPDNFDIDQPIRAIRIITRDTIIQINADSA